MALLVILTRVVLWLSSVAERDLHQVELQGTLAREWLPYSYGWKNIEPEKGDVEKSQFDLDLD